MPERKYFFSSFVPEPNKLETVKLEKSDKYFSPFAAFVAAGLWPRVFKRNDEYMIQTHWGDFSLLPDPSEMDNEQYEALSREEKNEVSMNRYKQLQYWQEHPEQRRPQNECKKLVIS